MANLDQVRKSKKVIIYEVKQRLEKDPNVGLHEFTASYLESKGIEVDRNNPREILERVKELKGRDRKKVGIAVKEYDREYRNAVEKLNSGLHRDITKLPRKAVATIVKGATKGIGLAATVNMVAPGLFSTGLGYLAGAGVKLPWPAKTGFIIAGSLAPKSVSEGAILAVGAIAGGVVYSAGKAVVTGVKKIVKSIQDRPTRGSAMEER